MNQFETVIKNYLDKRALEDVLFAKSYAKNWKSIEKCCQYIISMVKSTGRNGFDDSEIYSFAVHYYDEDDIKEPSKINCKVVVNLSDQTKDLLEKQAEEEYKQAKILELRNKEAASRRRAKEREKARKAKEAEQGQLSLFDM